MPDPLVAARQAVYHVPRVAQPNGEIVRTRFSSARRDLRVHRAVREAHRVDESLRYSINLIVEELFTNMVKYNTGGGHPIAYVWTSDGTLRIELVDEDVDPWDPAKLRRSRWISRSRSDAGRAGSLSRPVDRRRADVRVREPANESHGHQEPGALKCSKYGRRVIGCS